MCPGLGVMVLCFVVWSDADCMYDFAYELLEVQETDAILYSSYYYEPNLILQKQIISHWFHNHKGSLPGC